MSDTTSNSNPTSNAPDYKSRSTTTELEVSSLPLGIRYPHVTIEYCTQCKWMLRAAYFAQELLSTFSSTPITPSASSTSTTATTTTQPSPPQQAFTLPSITLIPSTGGTFIVTLYTTSPSTPSTTATTSQTITLTTTTLWNRKLDGGFPETKELKRRLRDFVDPERGLGHVDRDYGKGKKEKEVVVGEKKQEEETVRGGKEGKGETCMDCL